MNTPTRTPAPLLIDEAALDAELQAVHPVQDVEAGPATFPFMRLTARTFELLLYSLFRGATPPAPISVEYDRVRILNDGTDRGRDVVLYKEGIAVGVIQCKRREDAISLPEVFREIIRFILFAHLYPDLLPDQDDFTYVLALATRPAETAADLFHEQGRILAENDALIAGHVQKVIAEYESFRGIDAAAVLPTVKAKLAALDLHLLTEVQLAEWLHSETTIAQRYFPARVVIDPDGFQRVIVPMMEDLLLRARTPAAEVLQHWQTIGTVASTHANVAATRRNGRHKAPVRLEAVYVTRKIEREIDAQRLGFCGQGGLIAVVGPGGYGKTSLFWRVHSRLSEADPESCIALPPAELLAMIRSDDFMHKSAVLVAHVAARTAAGQPTCLLFDTFDVIAHDPSAGDAALGFIGRLVGAGATVLLSSRPEELSTVAIEDIATNCVRLYVDKYDEEEFAEAVRNYCAVFYDGSELADRHARKLVAAVRQDRPIREICLGPLTLRMLFELYAPDLVPENLNGFGLYGRYWSLKVQDDRRTGMHESERGRDLSGPLMAVAEAMAAFGLPSLSAQRRDQLVASGRIDEPGIAELLNRNLLVEGPRGALEFFHQTFFEYAAARAIVARADFDFDSFIGALGAQHEDRFLLPVHEQVLLVLAESRPEHWQQLGLAAGSFLADGHPALVNCAMVLHVFSSDGCPAVLAGLVASIGAGKKPLLRRYVQLLPNLGAGRAGEVVQVIRAAWARPQWAFREPAVNMLTWLARNDWSACKRLIDELDALESLYRTAPAGVSADRLAVDILTPGLGRDAGWVGERMTRPRPKHELRTTALEFLGGHPEVFASWPHQEVDAFIARLYDRNTGDSASEVRPALARLLAVLWTRDPARFPPDLDALEQLPNEHLSLALRALAHPGLPLAPALLEELVAETARIVDLERFYFWLNTLFLPALVDRSGHNAVKSEAFADVLAGMFTRFGRAHLDPQASPEPSRHRIIAKFVQRLYLHGILVDGAKAILSAFSPDQWLGADTLHSLFPVAIHLGLPQALDAYAQITARPDLYPVLARQVLDGLKEFAFSKDQLHIILPLALAQRNPAPLLELVRKGRREAGDGEVARVLGEVRPQLEQLEALVRSPMYAASKSAGYEWLAVLMELELMPVAGMQDLAELARTALKEHERCVLIPLIEHAAQAGERCEAISVLLAMGTSLPRTGRRRIVQALHSILQPDLPWPESEMLHRLSDFAFASLDDEPSVHLIGKLVLGFCQSGDHDTAHAIAIRLLEDPMVLDMGPTQMRTLAHHLDKTFQQLFDRLDATQMTSYVDKLPDLDPHLGRLLVVALCKSRRADAKAQLRAIVRLPGVSDDLKRVIQDYHRFGLR